MRQSLVRMTNPNMAEDDFESVQLKPEMYPQYVSMVPTSLLKCELDIQLQTELNDSNILLYYLF